MGTIIDYMRRAACATERGLQAFFHAVGEMPIHCYRCHTVYRLADGGLTMLADISIHRNTFHMFCRACAAAIREEYKYRLIAAVASTTFPTFASVQAVRSFNIPAEAKRVADQNMRALVHGAPATLTLPDWLRTLNDWKWSCCYCGKPFQALDHRIPIALGGGTTAKNCFPICNRCNSMKGSFHPDHLLLPSPRPRRISG